MAGNDQGAGDHPAPPSIEYDMDDPRFRIRPYQQVVSSCTGAFITSLTMTPLDVIKTRLQTQQKTMLSDKCFVYCNGLMDHLCPCYPATNGATTASTALQGVIPTSALSRSAHTVVGGPTMHPASIAVSPSAPSASAQHYKGTVDALLKISRHEGVSTLWSGLGPTLVLAVPATVIYFVFYEQLRIHMKDLYLRQYPGHSNKEQMPFFIPLLAGMTARITSVTVVNPMELVRTKMQSQRMSYFEVQDALRSVVQHEGWRGLWRGLGATLCRDVPFSGIYWTTYETIKKRWDVQGTPGFWFSFMAGAASGCLAAFLTTPFDVVKTHRQIEFGERFLYPDTAVKVQPSRNTYQMFQHIYRQSGISGLFAGVTPRLFKISPACAIMIGSFEYGKAFFHERNVRAYHAQAAGGGGGLNLSADVTKEVGLDYGSSVITLAAAQQFDTSGDDDTQ